MQNHNMLNEIPKTGPLLLVFDRDGTLVPYADHPDDAVMDESLKEVVLELVAKKDVQFALLSARSINDLKRDFDANQGVFLSGNYGLELMLPNGEVIVHDAVSSLSSEIAKAKDRFIDISNQVEGSIFEDHSFSLCLHWHNVRKFDKARLDMEMGKLKGELVNLRLVSYPTSFEVFPDIDWSKGNGLQLICSNTPYREQFVLFGGDTDSDEPAIEEANRQNGLSLRVGKDIQSTAAKYQFESPMQVKELLSQILNIR